MKKREDQEQEAVFDWAKWNAAKYPELEWMFHVPNGGKRNPAEAAHLKRLGVKPGVPDLCLPVARRGYHGLYIEMKADKGRVSEKQSDWLTWLTNQGYCTAVCHSAQQAIGVINDYLRGE